VAIPGSRECIATFVANKEVSMGRPRRHAELDVPHHIAHRGNHKQELFENDVDRRYYLALLHRFSRLTGTRIGGFCLMGNHIHVVAVPSSTRSLADCFGRTHRKYSEHLNRKRGARGTNWEGRYFAAAMSPRHTINALRYIERNPVEADLVSKPTDWEWSSAGTHCAMGRRWPLINVDLRGELADARGWRALIGTALNEEELQDVEWACIAASSGECSSTGYR